ncbi:uncharacterized protein PgNI_08151 [Pyricularia grisea]|uniref:BHLH domain-containing protein n=1 Tax=Pyricularia grisea TaxID=148305 RepID=A0A6P8AU39_PYRGI|nr:uncharacterized protein PgNI_08151 [Pyricularia grisea]TLD05722.1 hypothetical protein PgNI_08151 [Pyricularia grisea]
MLALQRLDSRMPQPQPPLPDEDPGLIFGWQIGVNVDEIFGFEREHLPQLTPPDNPQGPPILDTGDTDTLDAFFDHMHNNTEPPPNYGEGLAQLQDDWFSDIGPVPVLVGTSTTLGPQTDPTLSSPANLEMPQMTFPNVGPMVNGASQPASFTPIPQASSQHQNQRRPHHHHHHHHRQSHSGPAPPPVPSPIQIPLHQPHSEQEIAAATALQNTALFQNRTGRPDYSPYAGNQAPNGGVFGQRHQPQLAGQNHHSPVFSPIDNGASQPFGFTITPNQHASHAQEQPQVSANAFQPRVYMNGQAHVQPQPQRQPAPAASSGTAPAMFDNLRNPQYGSDPNFSRPHGYVPQTTQEESAQIEQERLKYVGCLEPVAPSSNETTGPTTPISPARRPTNLDKMLSEYDNATANGNAASIVKLESDESTDQKRTSVEGNDDEPPPFNSKGKGKAKPNPRPRPQKKLKNTPATARKSPSSDLAADTSAPGPSPLNSGDVEDDVDTAGKPSSGKRRKSSTAPQKQPRVNLTSEQKRLNHINSEKRRRGNIKDQLQDLQSEIDPIRDQKMSKGVVAEKTFEFIEALLRDNQYLLELSMQHGWSEDSFIDGLSQQHNGASQGSRPPTDNAYANNQSILSTPEQAFGMSLQNGHGDHHLHNGAQSVQPDGIHQPSMGPSAPHINGMRAHVSAASNGGNDLVSQPTSGYDSYTAAPQDSGAGNSGHVHNPQMFHNPTMFGQWNGNGAGTGAQIPASQMPTSPHTLYG